MDLTSEAVRIYNNIYAYIDSILTEVMFSMLNALPTQWH
jgi:hypothetical protein